MWIWARNQQRVGGPPPAGRHDDQGAQRDVRSYIREDPRHTEGRQVVFFAADDDGASTAFAEFVDAMGFAPVFVGGLREGGRLMQLGGPLSALRVIRQD